MSAEAKQQLRAELKEQRKAADPAELALIDAAIASAVESLEAFQNAPLVFTYLSFGPEVDTRALIERAWVLGKRVALPKCQPEGRLSWHIVDSFEDLVPSSFGMDEPDETRHVAVDISQTGSDAVALVPGLAFDADGYRLGYGGGFYDRFLVDLPGMSIGLCRSTTFYESLRALGVVDPHDVPVDVVVTGQA